MDISIIICTRNRADDLRATLRSIGETQVPNDVRAELLVVDNGSTDETPAVLQKQAFSNMAFRWMQEPTPGLSHARNTALGNARGEVLLCTDDDVRVPSNWIHGMTKPICDGTADAVAGGVRLAPHLQQPWMRSRNTGILAETRGINPSEPDRLVGANMAFHRRVLNLVPGFDPRLGAGALGMGEETLFSYQLRAAGFSLASAFDIEVEHHCDENRFTAQALRNAWIAVGRSAGYIDYHWRHQSPYNDVSPTLPTRLSWRGRLIKERATSFFSQNECPVTQHEAYLLRTWNRKRQFMLESQGPRRYTHRGLRLCEID